VLNIVSTLRYINANTILTVILSKIKYLSVGVYMDLSLRDRYSVYSWEIKIFLAVTNKEL
jgi:hypothetical protein